MTTTRRFPRVQLALDVHVRFENVADVLATRTMNISKEGLFIEMERPAAVGTRVRVTVEKRSGIVVATLLDKPLRPGAQKVPWNGRTWTGALAFTGAYQLHVVATNTVGKVSLVAPFVARRS